MANNKLISEVLQNSVAPTWDEARLEWHIENIYQVTEPQECACGHFPITELCEIKNSKNENVITVGNHCVQTFIGLNSNKLFNALKRIKGDDKSACNPDVIELAYKQNILTGWQRDFYIDTWRKRNLSDKQMTQRATINRKIILGISRIGE
jgi:hypothetical protein